MEVPPRPDEGGTIGRPIQTIVNMFRVMRINQVYFSLMKIRGEPCVDINFYDVELKEEQRAVYNFDKTFISFQQQAQPSATAGRQGARRNATPPEVNRRIIQALMRTHGAQLNNVHLAYDGRSNIFTSRPLPSDAMNFTVDFREEHNAPARKFEVIIRLAKVIDMSTLVRFLAGSNREYPQEAINALDVILTNAISTNDNFVQRGRSYHTRAIMQPLGGGLECWAGFYQSVRPVRSGLAYNLDISMTAFVTDRPVLDLASELWRCRDLAQYRFTDADRRILEMALKSVRVRTGHRAEYSRKYTVSGITPRSAMETVFELDGRTISVEDYFAQQYNVRLRFPNLPCLKTGRNTCLPFEICTIVAGQYYRRKLDEKQTAEMIKFANKRPRDRMRMINDGIGETKPGSAPELADIGLTFEREMMRVPSRVLDAPEVRYGNKAVRPQAGQWNLRDLKFQRGEIMENWGVYFCASERGASLRDVQDFVTALCDMAERTGIVVKNRRPPIVMASGRNSLEDEMRTLNEKVSRDTGSGMGFVLCMINGSAQTYGQIKNFLDCRIGCVSQCMVARNVRGRGGRGPNPQYLGNILMKINAKLAGLNSTVSGVDLRDDTMLIGADVSHGGGFKVAPSIAAVVGSMDRYASQYSVEVSVQSARCEDIRNMKDMIKALLGRRREVLPFPSRLIVFRDGVSEGQFKNVFHSEIRAIQSACQEIQQGYSPQLTFVIVQKRHHLRMFPANDRDGDRSGNCLPGTIIDTDITHPTDFDFYLMSHSGIQGTSRPVHYYVLHDDSHMSSNELQTMIYNLTYTFVRCPRSVSVVPPVYYAHLLAYRARIYATSDIFGSDTASQVSGGTSRSAEVDESKFRDLLKPFNLRMVQNFPMFFV